MSEFSPPKTMACPGGCGAEVSRALVACGPCWRRVPTGLRDAIYVHRTGTWGRMRAIGAVRAWFKANPK